MARTYSLIDKFAPRRSTKLTPRSSFPWIFLFSVSQPKGSGLWPHLSRFRIVNNQYETKFICMILFLIYLIIFVKQVYMVHSPDVSLTPHLPSYGPTFDIWSQLGSFIAIRSTEREKVHRSRGCRQLGVISLCMEGGFVFCGLYI